MLRACQKIKTYLYHKIVKIKTTYLMCKDRFEAAAEKLKLITTLVNLKK